MLTIRRAWVEQQLAADRARLVRGEARPRQIETEDEPSPYEIVVKAETVAWFQRRNTSQTRLE